MILLLASIGSYIGRGLVLDVIVMFGCWHDWIFAAAVRLFNSGDRSWHHSWQDRRTEFCPRHADGTLRSLDLFLTPDLHDS